MKEEMFDIFCTSRFSFLEDRFSRVCKVDPVVRIVGNSATVGDDGYLGVNLSLPESIWLTKVLKRHGVEACPIAESYKASRLSDVEAKAIAQIFISEERKRRPQLDLADLENMSLPLCLSKIAFGYISKSEPMKRDGISPGGIAVCVDRAGGFVMQPRQLLNAELLTMIIE